MFLARFACHTAKKNSQKRRKKINKMSRRKTKNYRENSGSKTKKTTTLDSVGAYGLNQSVQKQ